VKWVKSRRPARKCDRSTTCDALAGEARAEIRSAPGTLLPSIARPYTYTVVGGADIDATYDQPADYLLFPLRSVTFRSRSDRSRCQTVRSPKRDIRTVCAAALNAVTIRACYLAGQLLTSCEVINETAEVRGPVDPRDRAGSRRCRHRLPPFVGLFSSLRALRYVVYRRGCLCLGRLDLAHRSVVDGETVLATLRSVGGRCGGILTQHRRQAVPEVWLS
jgi:hypothetical protein